MAEPKQFFRNHKKLSVFIILGFSVIALLVALLFNNSTKGNQVTESKKSTDLPKNTILFSTDGYTETKDIPLDKYCGGDDDCQVEPIIKSGKEYVRVKTTYVTALNVTHADSKPKKYSLDKSDRYFYSHIQNGHFYFCDYGRGNLLSIDMLNPESDLKSEILKNEDGGGKNYNTSKTLYVENVPHPMIDGVVQLDTQQVVDASTGKILYSFSDGDARGFADSFTWIDDERFIYPAPTTQYAVFDTSDLTSTPIDFDVIKKTAKIEKQEINRDKPDSDIVNDPYQSPSISDIAILGNTTYLLLNIDGWGENNKSKTWLVGVDLTNNKELWRRKFRTGKLPFSDVRFGNDPYTVMGGINTNFEKGTERNFLDTQAFLYDVKSRKMEYFDGQYIFAARP